MFIKFKSISISNLFAYGKTPTVIKFDKHPATLLIGQNAAGKSSMLDALEFVLFGSVSRGIKKSQIVNGRNKKHGVGQVAFEIGARSYIVKRGIKPDCFEVLKDGVPLTEDSKIRDLQAYLTKEILRVDKKIFRQMISLGESEYTPFMKLKKEDRRFFVERVLGIEIFSIMNILLKKKNSEAELTLRDLESDADSIKEKIDIHQQYVGKKQTEGKHRIKEIKTEIAGIVLKKQATKAEVDRIAKEELPPLVDNLPKKKEAQAKLDLTNKQINKLDNKIGIYNKRISLIEKDACPMCEREFSKHDSEAEKESLHKKISNIKNKLEIGRRLSEKLINKIAKIEKRHDKIRDIRTRLETKNFSIQQHDLNIRRLEKQAERLKEAKEEDVQEILDQIEQLTDKINKNQEEQKALCDQKELYATALQLLKDEGIKTEIIRKYIPKINSLFKKYLELMGFDIEIELDEEFVEEVKTRYKERYTYKSFSSSERRRIDLALLFTWRALAEARNSVTSNLLILDEVLDEHLTTATTEVVLQVFKDTSFKGKNIFLVSQKHDIAGRFPKVMYFDMKDGYTRIS